ncbi:MAG: hypothetical protein JWN70_4532, partial [Planctomycetaceae bacterium]|nr:hypothetical protein [Planctomycetaceae bacterium]
MEGKYRNASIIHDVACVKMQEPWEAVHMAFYEACRCGGTGEKQAKILYAAVYHAGPRWKLRPVQAVSAVEGPDGKEVTQTTTRY